MRIRYLFTLGWFSGWLTLADFHDPADIASSVMWASFSLIVLIFLVKTYVSVRSGQFDDDEDEKPVKATREDFR